MDLGSEIQILRIQFLWDTLRRLVIRSNISTDRGAVCPNWFRKITTHPHILSHVNMECLDDWYPKSKVYISTDFRQALTHTSSIHSNALHYLALITDRYSLCG
jgi:hypothetical protein